MSEFLAAARVKRINASPSTAAAARARDLRSAGRDIVDMTIGEPDFDTPELIKNAAIEAIGRGETKYTPVSGTVALRQAISRKLKARTGIEYLLDEITVGGGAKQVIFIALMASVDAGAEVIIPAPYWVSYPDMVLANEGQPVIVPCPEEDGFKLTGPRLEAAITPRTRWLILNTPGNPSGSAYSREELREMANVLLRHPHVWIMTDEIYDEIWYEPSAVSSIISVEPRLTERTLLVNGVSKTYAMTGWRIGYGAGPASLISAMNKLQSHSSSCPSSISQAAAVAALSGDQGFVRATVAVYRDRRDLAVRMLNSIPGISCLSPAGAFYVFPNCAGVIGKKTPNGMGITTDHDFILYLLDSVGVAAIHGSAYGMSPYFRLSIATPKEVIQEGCERIGRACAVLSQPPAD